MTTCNYSLAAPALIAIQTEIGTSSKGVHVGPRLFRTGDIHMSALEAILRLELGHRRRSRMDESSIIAEECDDHSIRLKRTGEKGIVITVIITNTVMKLL
jgi:hypothetical protein